MLSLVADTTPQSFRLAYMPKSQLPLHRGAEVRSANAQRKPYTEEPRFALRLPFGKVGSRDGYRRKPQNCRSANRG